MQSSIFPSHGVDLVRSLFKKEWVSSREARAIIREYYPMSHLYIENSVIRQDGWGKPYNMKAIFNKFKVQGFKTESIAQDKYMWRTSDLQKMEDYLFNNQALLRTKNRYNCHAQASLERARLR